MVDVSQLPPESREALVRLEDGVRAALAAPSPHLAVVGRGAIERGQDPYASMGGGALMVPSIRAQLPHDAGEMRRLFQEVIHRAPGLRVVIINASRATDTEPWVVRHKLVAGVEVDALRKQRAKVDKRVKAELKSRQADPNADVGFGRFYDSGEIKVEYSDANGRQSQPTSDELMQCFEEARRIYESAGFELTHAIWWLRGRRSTGGGSPGWSVTESFL